MEVVGFGLIILFFMTIVLLICGWEERREIRRKMRADFEHMKFLFNYACIRNGVQGPYLYKCNQLRRDLWETEIRRLYGVEEIDKHLRSGHRTKAWDTLFALQGEWETKGFKIYGTCQCSGCKKEKENECLRDSEV